MVRYSEEFKAQVVRQMMPPSPVSVEELSRETGVTSATLYNWRKQFRAKGVVVPDRKGNTEQWSSEDKFAVVVETSSMNESELSEYCRRTGLYPEQIASWRRACLLANESADKVSKVVKRHRQEDRKKVKGLERELRRKEKALAEAAALLILKKKAEAYWGDDEDDT
jgi:transposase-like protein